MNAKLDHFFSLTYML